jgi:hypothetical protein
MNRRKAVFYLCRHCRIGKSGDAVAIRVCRQIITLKAKITFNEIKCRQVRMRVQIQKYFYIYIYKYIFIPARAYAFVDKWF